MELNKTKFQIEIINRIRDLRIKNKVSQTKLADYLNIGSGQIGNIESPKFKHKYTLKQLYLISEMFNVTFDYLLTGEECSLSTKLLIKYLISYDE